MSNDFLPFAVGSSPNVLSQADYAALPALASGFQSGVAKSQQLNKVWRQSSIMAAVLAQFIVNNSGQNAVDDGTTATLLTNLTLAIKAAVRVPSILADTGAANAYTATNTTPLAVGTWVDGVSQRVKIANTNTGASTYAPDGLAAIPIYGLGLQPLQGGELLAGGTAALVRATIAGVNSGNPICVLVDCQGGAQQVPVGTKSNQAVNLGQADGRYAALAGLASQLFSAADGTTGKQVVNISQFIGSFGPTGYVRLPGGFILQWTNLTGSTGWAWTYPIAFPAGCYGAVATNGDTGPSFVTLYNIGASLLQGNRWNTAGVGVSGSVIIFAIGY